MNNGDRLREMARQAKMDKRTEIKESKGYALLMKDLEQIAEKGQNCTRILSIDVMSLFDESVSFNELQAVLASDEIRLDAVYDSGTNVSYAIFKFSWK